MRSGKRKWAITVVLVAETVMFRIKTLLGGHLSLRNYDAQVGEVMAMVKALNRMTLLAMPTSVRLV